MTPLHDGTLEAAARDKLAVELISARAAAVRLTRALGRSDWTPSRSHVEGVRNTLLDLIVAAEDALAIKPTPAGEGEASVNFRDLGLPKPTEADIAYIKKHHPYMPFPAPAASPVQGVDAVERAADEMLRAAYGVEPKYVSGHRGFFEGLARALDSAGLLTATPQSPSTVDERVKK